MQVNASPYKDRAEDTLRIFTGWVAEWLTLKSFFDDRFFCCV